MGVLLTQESYYVGSIFRVPFCRELPYETTCLPRLFANPKNLDLTSPNRVNSDLRSFGRFRVAGLGFRVSGLRILWFTATTISGSYADVQGRT